MTCSRGRNLLLSTSLTKIMIPLISSAIRIEASSLMRARYLAAPKFFVKSVSNTSMRMSSPLLHLRGGSRTDEIPSRKSKFDFKAACQFSGKASGQNEEHVKDALYQLTTQIFSSKTDKLPDYYEVLPRSHEFSQRPYYTFWNSKRLNARMAGSWGFKEGDNQGGARGILQGR